MYHSRLDKYHKNFWTFIWSIAVLDHIAKLLTLIVKALIALLPRTWIWAQRVRQSIINQLSIPCHQSLRILLLTIKFYSFLLFFSGKGVPVFGILVPSLQTHTANHSMVPFHSNCCYTLPIRGVLFCLSRSVHWFKII